MANNKEKVTYVTSKFHEALKDFTSWAQVLSYFAGQPATIRNKTYEKIQADIDSHASNRDGETSRVTDLEARLQELKTAAND